jgi:hypothetical protein
MSVKQMSRGGRIGIAVFGVLIVGAIVMQIARGDGPARLRAWAEETQRPNAEVLETARAAVESMERDGAIVSRSCDPNMTIVKGAMWRSLPADRYRTIAARSLALLCEQTGTERSMTVYSERGDWLGRYNEDDSFQTSLTGSTR